MTAYWLGKRGHRAMNGVESSLRWSALGNGLRLTVQFLQLFILARLLSPEVFGQMALVSITMALVLAFSDLGFSASIVYLDKPDDSTRSMLFWCPIFVAIALGVVVYLFFAIASEGTVSKLEKAHLIFYGFVIALVGLIGGLPKALAEKRMQFKTLVQCESFAHLCGAVIAVILAVQGQGVASMVVGAFVTQFLSSALFWARVEQKMPPLPTVHIAALRPFYAYGLPVAVGRLINSVSVQTDMLVATSVFGPDQLGLYSVPRNLCLQAVGLINPIVNRVAFPLIAMQKGEADKVKNTYQTALYAICSLNAPLFAGVFWFCDALTALLLGPGWEEAIPIFRLLSVWGMLRAVGNPVGTLLLGTGRAKRALVWDVLVMLVVLGAVVIGNTGNADDLALALVVALLMLYLPLWFILVAPSSGISLFSYLASTLVPIFIAWFSGALSRWMLDSISNDLLLMVLGMCSLTVVHFSLLYLVNRERFRQFKLLLPSR